MPSNILRLIDANLNRCQEGLRVCEDILRFMLDERVLSGAFKSARHRIGVLSKRIEKASDLRLLKSRSVKRDVGKKTTYRESRRKDLREIFLVNIQRAKESLRVLEEIAKLLDRNLSRDFKAMRFRIYELEKKTRIKLEALLHNR